MTENMAKYLSLNGAKDITFKKEKKDKATGCL